MKQPATGLLPVHPTHYERLGVAVDASAAEIEAAWRLHQSMHATLPAALTPSLALPGTPTNDELDAAALRLAHEVLRDEARRAVYNAWLQREAAGAAAQNSHQRWWRRRGLQRLSAVTLAVLLVIAVLAWQVAT